MRLIPRPTIAGSPCEVGTIYLNENDYNVYICIDPYGYGTWLSSDPYWTQSGDEIYLSDINQFVGIAETTAPSKLYLQNDGGIIAEGTGTGFQAPATTNTPRFIWHPGKGAIRAGAGTSPNWDESLIGNYSATFGYDTKASKTGSTALGDVATATGDASTALGEKVTARANYSTVIGSFSSTTDDAGAGIHADYSTVIGQYSTGKGEYSTAIGQSAIAQGAYSTAIGTGVTADGVTQSGSCTSGGNCYTTAIGYRKAGGAVHRASGNAATAIGTSSLASGDYSTTLGTELTASGNYSTAVGSGGTTAEGELSVAIGYGALSQAANSIAIGTSASVDTTAVYGIAIGNGANVTGTDHGIAVGINAAAQDNGTAIGKDSSASGLGATAIGREADASAQYATAIGYGATASGNSAVSIGRLALSSGQSAVALGQNASSLVNNGIAIGNISVQRIGSLGINLGDTAETIDTADNQVIIVGGQVGIGTVSPDPSVTLHVVGTLTAVGITDSSSSREVKENIRDLNLSRAISVVNGLNPVTYQYKHDKNKNTRLGFIAEDSPDFVTSPEKNAIIPMNIVANMVKVVQHHQKIIEAQQREIQDIEEKLNQIE